MHIENGPITLGKDGKTSLHFEIVIEESYAPGTLHDAERTLRREFYGVLTVSQRPYSSRRAGNQVGTGDALGYG